MFETFVNAEDEDDPQCSVQTLVPDLLAGHKFAPPQPAELEKLPQFCICGADEPAGEDPPSLPNDALIRRLGWSDYQSRQSAFSELQERGLCALPELLSASTSGNVEIGRRAQLLITRLGTDAVPYLLSAGSNDQSIRSAANRALDRIELGTLLNYGYNDADSQANVRQILSTRPERQAELSTMVAVLEQTGIATETGLRQCIVAAELMNRHKLSFHASMALGMHLLEQPNPSSALEPLDRCLRTLRTHSDHFSALHALDLRQQLQDSLDRVQLPENIRQQIQERVNQASQELQRFKDSDSSLNH